VLNHNAACSDIECSSLCIHIINFLSLWYPPTYFLVPGNASLKILPCLWRLACEPVLKFPSLNQSLDWGPPGDAGLRMDFYFSYLSKQKYHESTAFSYFVFCEVQNFQSMGYFHCVIYRCKCFSVSPYIYYMYWTVIISLMFHFTLREEIQVMFVGFCNTGGPTLLELKSCKIQPRRPLLPNT
jgi:hypothetical protein